MNNIYYALFINADGSDEGMLTPNQLVGIFDTKHLQAILRRELMLSHIHGEILADHVADSYPPDTYMVETLSRLDTSNVWFTMVAPNIEDFDSDSGTFINVSDLEDEEREALIARLVEQGADEEELRAMVAEAASDASDTPAEEEPLTPLAAGYIGAAKELLRLSGISHYEYHRSED